MEPTRVFVSQLAAVMKQSAMSPGQGIAMTAVTLRAEDGSFQGEMIVAPDDAPRLRDYFMMTTVPITGPKLAAVDE